MDFSTIKSITIPEGNVKEIKDSLGNVIWAKGAEWIVSESGRKFKRNNKNTGTVMEWDDNGVIRQTIIFDAKYRKKLEYSNNENLPSPYYTGTGKFYPGSEQPSIPVDAADYTDEILNSKPNCSQDRRNNKDATDNLINTIGSDASYACGYVRSLTNLNSGGCDLPTINCLTRIYGDMVILDSLDPTIEEFSDYTLSSWFYYTDAWTASCRNNEYALSVTYFAEIVSGSRGNADAVVPVLDIL